MKKVRNDELGRRTPQQYQHTPKLPVTVILDNVRSMNNVGSIFRSCDAFLAERLFLCGITGAPPDREIHKTALGAETTVAWEHFRHTADALIKLKEEGYTILAVEQVTRSVALQNFAPVDGNKYALVFGNEVDGVSEDALGLCSGAIEIPQAGTKHSINVAVSAGVVLWHFFWTPWAK